MIPDLNSIGLLPPGVHECTLSELRAVFGQGFRRENLIQGLVTCLEAMKDAGLAGDVLVAGSFVTDKEMPGDVELTLDVRNMPREAQDRALLFYGYPISVIDFSVYRLLVWLITIRVL